VGTDSDGSNSFFNSHYNIDTVLINGDRYVTIGGLYNDQYDDWIADKTLNIADYSTLALSGGYYEISTVQGLKDLLCFSGDPSYKFRLSADIDLASAPGLWIPWLMADFDGSGHTISNLVINQPFSSAVGMFGTVGSDIANLGLVNVSVVGLNPVGGLVGGIIGKSDDYAAISNCYVTGSVTATDGNGGGLAGWAGYSDISNCYVTGSVTGADYVGGLLGYGQYTNIINSYATNSVTGAQEVGGLAGGFGESASISNSYFAGSVTGTQHNVGGLAGEIAAGFAIDNSFYNIDDVLINGGHYVTIGGIYNAQYSDWIADKTLSIADYPTLALNGGYYEISTVQGMKDLLGFAGDSSLEFRLSADIDLASAHGLFIPWLEADFDGSGHTISNLVINQPFSTCVGMFGAVSSDISNLGLQNVSVVGHDNAGGLAGHIATGTIINCYVTGSVTAMDDSAGGLVGGSHSGLISNSYAAATVTGTDEHAGGLVGKLSGSSAISNCYATGTVTGTTNVGGLVGYNEDGTGTIASSYWDTDLSGLADGVGAGGGGGTGLTTAEMMQQASFVGWDFDNIWYINEGITRPLLRMAYSTVITTPEQLQLMALNLAANYTLGVDLDMVAILDFEPVGDYTTPFTGTFDGLGHTISNLTINRPGEDYVGLFGCTDGAVIRNVGLIGSSVTGAESVGGLVGYSQHTDIINYRTLPAA